MLSIGVIGAGHLGKIHLKLLKELKSYQLKGFYDNDATTRQQVSETLGITAYADAESLIAACDVVDIVTPTLSHFKYAMIALNAGKHIFIEKPITNTLQEAEEMISLAEQKGLKIQIGHVERFNPAFVAAQSKIRQPMFIEAHRLAEFNPRGTDVPVVLDLMIHDIDVILSIVKSEVKLINTSGVSIISDTPDIANARIEFENGCVANLTASRISMKNMRKARIFQGDSYIAVDFLKKKTEIISMRNTTENESPFAIIIDPGNGKPNKTIEFNNPVVEESNAIKEELRTFAIAVENNTTPIVSATDGYKALKVAHQIMDKLSQQKFTES
ncbi:MAG TPA: Gfo/Idh/MocA family oxidoreductase [Bacteroidia bacterium]|jgi:predicted dehydrogenase|nr:Gfo/Idh/MocA family oxidoreductase [Bacteroidia bacterium]QQR95288.1 MAG: Gfo/Idh/MocA family oxidoreductase [Bacteroidota bacterium]MBP7715387.1 Gfo/Idh/MocA family oxidoreductase [Bacteroidia bacterium]MBP8669143.1 Gfo/Idh/MocA family oxidoreductase [Bacteroidia bacterium]HOZ82456.1 Gfo/Idh/MocA family oxidoreductase [Bacteroidia bacterium]